VRKLQFHFVTGKKERGGFLLFLDPEARRKKAGGKGERNPTALRE